MNWGMCRERQNLSTRSVPVSDLPNTTAATQDAMRLAIEKERRLELAFEGTRWYDLKRTGRAIEVINNADRRRWGDLGYNLTENKLIWPIPQA